MQKGSVCHQLEDGLVLVLRGPHCACRCHVTLVSLSSFPSPLVFPSHKHTSPDSQTWEPLPGLHHNEGAVNGCRPAALFSMRPYLHRGAPRGWLGLLYLFIFQCLESAKLEEPFVNARPASFIYFSNRIIVLLE